MDLIHKELSGKIIRAFHEVHHHLGPGYLESIYHNALMNEMKRRKIPFEREKIVEIFYKNEKVGEHRLDFIVDGKVIVELKAVPQIISVHEAQVISYLKATGIKVGLLVNFGNEKVKFKRFVL